MSSLCTSCSRCCRCERTAGLRPCERTDDSPERGGELSFDNGRHRVSAPAATGRHCSFSKCRRTSCSHAILALRALGRANPNEDSCVALSTLDTSVLPFAPYLSVRSSVSSSGTCARPTALHAVRLRPLLLTRRELRLGPRLSRRQATPQRHYQPHPRSRSSTGLFLDISLTQTIRPFIAQSPDSAAAHVSDDCQHAYTMCTAPRTLLAGRDSTLRRPAQVS